MDSDFDPSYWDYEGSHRLMGSTLLIPSGNVQVYYNGAWGSVRENSFDSNEARVTCKAINALDIGTFMAYHNSNFGVTGNGNIILNELMCGGGENSLFNCGRNPYQYGYISSTSDDAGVQCNEGCQYGYTWDGHRCVPPCLSCPKGKYNDETNAGSCKDCTAGFSNSNMASTSVTHCIACDAGKYSAAGQPLCKTCMPGKYVLSPASDNCTTCNGGERIPAGAETSCQACGSGTFRPHGRENVLYPEKWLSPPLYESTANQSYDFGNGLNIYLQMDLVIHMVIWIIYNHCDTFTN